MKRLIYLFTILLFVASCGQQKSHVQHFNFGGGYDHITTAEPESPATVKNDDVIVNEQELQEPVLAESNAKDLKEITGDLNENSSKKEVVEHLKSLQNLEVAKNNVAPQKKVKRPVRKLRKMLKEQKRKVKEGEEAQNSGDLLYLLLVILLIALILSALGIDLLTVLIIFLLLLLLGVIVV